MRGTAASAIQVWDPALRGGSAGGPTDPPVPKRDDIRSILLIGSGPIVIGQACEFDYSGSQAARALRAEGFRLGLMNSNPATIMTDPIMADEVYLRELTPKELKKVVEEFRPDAVIPTMGGQTALNLAATLHDEGYWEEQGIEIIGVDIDAIRITEDRQAFRDLMDSIGLDQARSRVAKSLLEAKEITQELAAGPDGRQALGFQPIVIRPSFTMGGAGGGIVWTPEEFDPKVRRGLELSPVHEVLIEECLYGWKEYELELLRDAADNVVIVCSIENVDPMGVHTGDSVTVAPQQTLTDPQYQQMRDAAIRAMRSIGTFAGGCNIQFAVNPEDGRMIVIEINPRVSRSSALASKATGYPIAKVAARLAAGYTLDELKNEITGTTSACFEPAIDYVVTKVPRFNFEKFEGVSEELTTQMKAVGEAMAIGRTFQESLNKAMQSLELGYAGLGADRPLPPRDLVRERLKRPYWDRLLHIRNAFKLGASVDEIADVTRVDRWFLYQVRGLVRIEDAVQAHALDTLPEDLLREAKEAGFSDVQLAWLLDGELSEDDVAAHREKLGLVPTFRVVDTCAGEFEAETPYYYSTYDGAGQAGASESVSSDREKVLILGSGPNRIGQGIEFDYSCVHAVLAAKEMGYEAILINCNPETVSTDFDVADTLYFEPVFWERVKAVIDHESPRASWCRWAGRRRSSSPSACWRRASTSSARRTKTWTSPRTAASSPRCWKSSACPSPSTPWRAPCARPSARRTRWATPCSSARATCSAARACASPSTATRRRATSRTCSNGCPATRCCSTASSRTARRSTATPSRTARRSTSSASCSTSSRRACTRATPRPSSPPTRSRRPSSRRSARR